MTARNSATVTRPAIGDPIAQHDAVLAGAILGSTPEQVLRARRYIEGSVKDAEDALTLCRMLGLVEQATS